MKINSTVHGILDYGVVIFLLVSPNLFHLPEMTATFTYILAAIHFLLTICTDFKPGLFKLIPFQVHGMIELIVSLALVGVAFYLGNKENELARNFYLGFAAAVFLVWLLTDYRSAKVNMFS